MNMYKRQGFVNSQTLMGVGVIIAVILLLTMMFLTWTTVEGDEVGVRETWSGGVDPQSLGSRTYFRNRWTETIFTYKISGQVFVMNDKPNETFGEGRRADVLEIKSQDSQKVHFNITVQWHRDPRTVVEMHKTYRDNVEEKLLRPEVVNSMTTHATVMEAATLYSGKGRNVLRESVEKELRDPNGPLARNGCMVDKFIIDDVNFPNKDYVNAIESRQLQIVIKSKAEEEAKANASLAEAAKIKAQILQNETVVAAETSKRQAILQQEAESGRAIIKAKADAENLVVTQEAEAKKVRIAAEAEAARQIAIAEANKQAEINRAIGIRAVGEAQADAQKMLLSSYAVPGSDLYARVKVSEQFAIGMDKVRFYPANANFTTIAESFNKGLNLLVGQAPEAK